MTKTCSEKVKLSATKIARIAIFVALIAVGAFIKVPIGIVPVSLQCTMCILAALLLGPWDSLICVTVYIAMGLIGIPIFTAGGGFAYVLQPTFGYLIGYIFALPLAGVIARGVKCDKKPSFWRFFVGALAAIAVVYTLGVMYMYLMLNFYVGTAMSIDKAWLSGAAVFLPTDITFCAIASFVASKVIPRLKNR